MPVDQSDDPRHGPGDEPSAGPGADPSAGPGAEPGADARDEAGHDSADEQPRVSSGSRGRRGGDGHTFTRRRLIERRTQRYYLLVCLLLVDIFVIALAGAGALVTLVYAPLTAAILLLALRTSEARRRTMRVAWVAAGIVVVTSVTVYLTGQTRHDGWIYLMLSALLIISPLAIFRRIVESRKVTLPLLVAAICVYLMIGLFFTFADLGLNGVHPPFFAQATSAAPVTEPSIYLYFSYITMTTVGYGDFTPASALPRAVCVFEAILGQVFLVTAVARLVSLYGLQQPAPESTTGDEQDAAP